MGKVCTACGGAVPAPQKPENEAEMCPMCAGAESAPAPAACQKCAEGVQHDHAAM